MLNANIKVSCRYSDNAVIQLLKLYRCEINETIRFSIVKVQIPAAIAKISIPSSHSGSVILRSNILLSSLQVSMIVYNRVGGAVSPDLSHHRAYGSVHGGSIA